MDTKNMTLCTHSNSNGTQCDLFYDKVYQSIYGDSDYKFKGIVGKLSF